jgi:hypothetical protein
MSEIKDWKSTKPSIEGGEPGEQADISRKAANWRYSLVDR